MFLDRPSVGVAFRRVIQLMLSADPAEWSHLRPFCEGVVRACSSPDPTALDAVSTLNSKWKQVAYTKALLSSATAAWDRGSGGKNVFFSNGPNSTSECFNLLY